MKKIIIAIDGHSGCGKSTTAKLVAQDLGYAYIDTGAMYRAVTLFFLQEKVDVNDSAAVSKALQEVRINFKSIEGVNTTFLNDENVEDEIRGLNVASRVSEVAAIVSVRKSLVDLQRKMGDAKGVVMDGRDIGTNVFPNAEVKIFMTADVQKRAERRVLELSKKGESVSLEEVVKNLSERDLIDSTRSENPLKKAIDAVEVDTTGQTIESQVQAVLDVVRKAVV